MKRQHRENAGVTYLRFAIIGLLLLIDHNRIGRFFSEAEVAAGADSDWTSLFAF